MNNALIILSHGSQVIRDLKVNPWLLAVTLALGAAWLEQKAAQRHTPSFTADHQDTAAKSTRRAPR